MNEQERAARVAALKAELLGSALTVDEVAHVLGCERTTVLRALREGRLVGFQLGRTWRVPSEEVRAYVARLKDKRGSGGLL